MSRRDIFYFFAAINRANSHPINDQPNSQEPNRTRDISSLDFSHAVAKYTGVKTIHTNIAMTTIYFKTNKISFKFIIYIPYFACSPNSSSIRINWLYFAIRSVRDMEPVFIWPAFVATAKSAIVVSSVSPLRWETITP